MKLPNPKLQGLARFQARSSDGLFCHFSARFWALLGSLLLGAGSLSPASAQPLSNLVFTVGTTIQDAGLQNWSYVLLGAPAPQLLAGKQFAIFGKAGFPTNSGTFTARGTIFQQTDISAINNLLNQSAALGEDLSSLNNALNVIVRSVPGAPGQSLPQKVLTAFQTAATDSAVAAELLVLERMHPGLTRCAGQGFAEVITTTTTYEVREFNPMTSVAGDVVGRVTITPGAPVVLPAPGFPFQVVTNAPSDHLRVRLRWGTPDMLRRLSLLQFGFNVWRIPLAAAEAGNFNVTPPTAAQLHSNPSFTLVNSYPVMATTDYAPLAGPGGPDDPTDRTTYFFADSNGRSPGSAQFPTGTTPPGYLTPPFNDGDPFYYFITARDVLGRDGLVSPGGLAMACRKNLPSAPTKLSVLNAVRVIPLGGGSFTNQQQLLLRWLQNTNISDVVTQYWVYRWPNPTMALTNDSTPSNNLVGVVAHVANTNFAYLLDTNASSPATPGPSNYWYTVRAVSQSACSLLFSPNSAPASGVLRQRAAPAATTGTLLGSCGTPAVMFQNFNPLVNTNGPSSNNWNYRVTVTRRDSGIAWVQLLVGNNFLQVTQALGPLYFPPNGNSLSVDFALPISPFSSEFDASCVAGTYYGTVSQAAICQTTNPVPAGQITEAVFQAGELLFTALNSSDPFVQAVNLNQSVCVPAINPTRDSSGTVHMRFDVGGGQPMMIQYATNLNAVTFWTDIGVATPDTNGVYSAYLCPCIIGPLPQLRGCTVNLPAEGSCDQHVARAGDGGAIAPIVIRFRLTPRTHEYRLYRSVNGGEPTLVAQAEAMFDPSNPGNEMVRTDDAMPPSGARLCYFVQTLDENGNGSPLALIGCKDVVPAKPPRPVLSEPAPVGDVSNPQVALTWFCPTTGVYRFEIRITRDDQPASGKPTGLLSSKLILLNAFKPLPFASVKPRPFFYGLVSDRKAAVVYDEWQLTPPVGPSFGPGPQFSITANILPNVPYEISVAAEDNQGNWGDASANWKFTWKPPPTIQTVPWPARPLPPVKGFDEGVPPSSLTAFGPRVSATLLHDANLTLDPQYPVGVRIGDLSSIYNASPNQALSLNVNTTNFASYIPPAGVSRDPQSLVFKRRSGDPDHQGDPLLPIVVYRQQATNATFPRVSGNLTQVSPLIESIPWVFYPGIFGGAYIPPRVVVPDFLIAFGIEFDPSNADLFQNSIFVRDQQPVILGARYHYYVVRMSAQREVTEVIDAGTVDIPAQ